MYVKQNYSFQKKLLYLSINTSGNASVLFQSVYQLFSKGLLGLVHPDSCTLTSSSVYITYAGSN